MQRDQESLREQFESNQAQFVMTELETSITFCRVALSAKDTDRIKRNVRNACIGYKTAMRYWDNSDYDLAAVPEYCQKLDVLKSLLQQLGQEV